MIPLGLHFIFWEQNWVLLALLAETSSQTPTVSKGRNELNVRDMTGEEYNWIHMNVCYSYYGFFACFQSVTLQETDNNHLHDEDSVAHPNAVARTEPKWHECVRVHLLTTVFTEPAHTDRYSLDQEVSAERGKPRGLNQSGLSFSGLEDWSQSQLTLDEGGLHPGQVTSSSHCWCMETNNNSLSHSNLRAIQSH